MPSRQCCRSASDQYRSISINGLRLGCLILSALFFESMNSRCYWHQSEVEIWFPSMKIPQEIIDNVIAAVGDDDTHLLKRCSLVSSSFLHPIRKQLFSRVTLESNKSCQEILKFLVQNPVIQSFVSISLKYMSKSRYAKWMNGKSLLAILRLPLRRLECFSIAVDPINRMNWNGFRSELQDAILNIINSSTFKTLSLVSFTVPITFFSHIVHLTTLELHSLSPNDFIGENSWSLTQADSKRVAISQAMIDRCVWRFSVEDVM